MLYEYSRAGLNCIHMDSIWARWKCTQYVDLILGFLLLVGNLPTNEIRKVTMCSISRWCKLVKRPQLDDSVLTTNAAFVSADRYNILTLPRSGLPAFSMGTASTEHRQVILQKWEVILEMFFNSVVIIYFMTVLRTIFKSSNKILQHKI